MKMNAAAVLLVGALACAAWGQGASFAIIPLPPGITAITAQRISADGSTVIGYTSGTNAFRWTAAGGSHLFGPVTGGNYTIAAGLSADGTVVTGNGTSYTGYQPFRWTVATGFTMIVGLPGSGGTPMGGCVSADGHIEAGWWLGQQAHPWRFIEGFGTQVIQGNWEPVAMSGDGSVMVGRTGQPSELAVFPNTAGEVELIAPPAGYSECLVSDVSGDGTAATGSLKLDVFNGARNAFRWTRARGFEVLSTGADSYADGVSWDGSVVVGNSGDGAACAWTANVGAVDLASCLGGLGVDLQGRTLFEAFGVSADGRSITGITGGGESWIAHLPRGFGCYANCDGSAGEPVLNVADFTCFLQRFSRGDGYANCDGSSADPLLNVADFTCFLQKFAGGCS